LPAVALERGRLGAVPVPVPVAAREVRNGVDVRAPRPRCGAPRADAATGRRLLLTMSDSTAEVSKVMPDPSRTSGVTSPWPGAAVLSTRVARFAVSPVEPHTGATSVQAPPARAEWRTASRTAIWATPSAKVAGWGPAAGRPRMRSRKAAANRV